MANVGIFFEIEGEKQVASLIENVSKKLDDFRSPLTAVNNLLLSTWDKNFDSEGSTIGEPWKKLSPRYKKRKDSKFPGKPILVATGKMRNSFRSKTGKLQTELYNTSEYFKFHQSNKPRTKLPRRVMMKIDDKRRAEIFREFTKYLNRVARNI